MEYRQLGSSDLKVSVFGLGGNTFGPPRIDQEMTTININRAQELGVNFIDTAHGYTQGTSEEFVGNAVKGKRDQWVIATKFDLRNLEGEAPRQRILRHFEESVSRLQTDYVDLYQIHFPAPSVPEEEILETMDGLVRQGKVRYIGECNHASWRTCEAIWTSRKAGLAEYVSAQHHYNLLRRHVEQEVLPLCEAYNLGFIPYFPLAAGYLTGKYRPGEPPPPGTRGAAGSPAVKRHWTTHNEAIVAELEQFATERSHTMGELAMAWLLSHPEVSMVITGTSNPEQVQANAVATDWHLTPEEREEVDRIAAWDGTGEPVESYGG